MVRARPYPFFSYFSEPSCKIRLPIDHQARDLQVFWPASLLVVVVKEKSFDVVGVVLSCNMAKIVSLLSFDVLEDVISLADA